MLSSSLLQEVQDFLASPSLHAKSSSEYKQLENLWIPQLRQSFVENQNLKLVLFGKSCIFPFIKQGQVDSADLLGLFELMLFRWYSIVAYHHTSATSVDIGANIGFHTLFMANCFNKVNSFDPDAQHAVTFTNIMKANNVSGKVTLSNTAVADSMGQAQFTRVLNNTTASYIDNLKTGYGPLEHFKVSTIAGKEAAMGAIALKIDAEGAEFKILRSININQWEQGLICFFEVSRPENRKPIFDLLSDIGVGIYPQSCCWSLAKFFSDLPSTWRDGNCAAFIQTQKNQSIYSDFMTK